MARVLAIDYGLKNCGIAVTDNLKMIAQSLTTVDANKLMAFLDTYLNSEEVDTLVVGLPMQMNYTPSEIEPHIKGFIKRFSKKYPTIEICRIDERFTSKLSQQTLIMAGAGKNQRRNKALVDTISATIILQTFLTQKKTI